MLLQETLRRYLAVYPEESTALAPLAEQIAQLPADNPRLLFSRKTLPGHITGSGLALRGRQMLMVFHPYLKRWLQPGGHVEAKETPCQAAIREVLEETGLRAAPRTWSSGRIQANEAIPFDIDIHQIPANPQKDEPEHFHYDFRYLLEPKGAAKAESELICEWQDFSAIKEANLRRVIAKLNFFGLC